MSYKLYSISFRQFSTIVCIPGHPGTRYPLPGTSASYKYISHCVRTPPQYTISLKRSFWSKFRGYFEKRSSHLWYKIVWYKIVCSTKQYCSILYKIVCGTKFKNSTVQSCTNSLWYKIVLFHLYRRNTQKRWRNANSSFNYFVVCDEIYFYEALVVRESSRYPGTGYKCTW